MKVFFTIFLFVFLISECYSNKILVVLDDFSTKNTHSQFFKNLEEKGYTLDFQLSQAQNKLLSFGDYNYENVLLMAPKSSSLKKKLNFFRIWR
jgi:oligosaccharyltransferase complex subunit beta